MDLLRWLFRRRRSHQIAASNLMEPVRVSTLHLGPADDGGPVYETMVFGGRYDSYERRYRSYCAAVVGHHETVSMVSGSR